MPTCPARLPADPLGLGVDSDRLKVRLTLSIVLQLLYFALAQPLPKGQLRHVAAAS